VPPWANLILAFVRCALLLAALLLVGKSDRRAPSADPASDRTSPPPANPVPAALGAAVLLGCFAAVPARARDFPPPDMLEQYKAGSPSPPRAFPPAWAAPARPSP
jgi:hypothetical protein